MSNANAGLSPLPLSGGSASDLHGLPLDGGRRGKKLRVVKKKTVKKLLRRFGMKMRGMGAEEGAMAPADSAAPAEGGRRRRGSRKTRRGSRKSRK